MHLGTLFSLNLGLLVKIEAWKNTMTCTPNNEMKYNKHSEVLSFIVLNNIDIDIMFHFHIFLYKFQ